MRFRLLGPVEVVADDAVITVPGGRLLILLSGLLLRANQVVPVERLVRWLWEGTDPDPARARATVQEYVRRLRRAIGSDDVIRTAAGGYLIEADDDSLDLLRFRTLSARGRTAAEAGEPRAAAERLTAALDLWRGPALSNVDSRTLHDDELTSLDEHHLQVREQWAEVLLRVGQHQPVIPELRRLTREHPLREKPWELLLIALYRDHRQAEALAAYDTIRGLLAGELGVDPGPALRRVHRAVLTNDAALDPDDTVPPIVREPPRQLPADISHFTGRGRELDFLVGLARAPGEGALAIAAIEGTAGVGKTTLAVHATHRVAGNFPDGQLYLNLRGHGPGEPVAPGVALATLLQVIGIPADHIPADLDARTALWRTCTTGRRVIVVLDNVRDTEQARPLLPGTGCVALLTSRNQLRGLIAREGARRITLDRLDPPEALDLLGSIVGIDRVRTEPGAARRMIDMCARLPLAIRILGERISRHSGTRLAEVADDLGDQQDRMAVFNLHDDEDTNLGAVFGRSYLALDSAAARLFRLLGTQAATDFTAPAAAAIVGLAVVDVQPLLDRLVSAHLLESQPGRRYQLHDLMREFAKTHAQRDEAHEASRRLLDWYLHTTVNGDRKLNPTRTSPVPYPVPLDIRPLDFTDFADALAWFDGERANLLAASGQALQRGINRPVAWLARELFNYLRHRAHHSDQLIALCRVSLAASRQLGDRNAEAFALNGLGVAHAQLGSNARATSCFLEALDIWRDIGESLRIRQAHTNLSTVYERNGQYEEAISYGLKSLRMAQESGLPEQESMPLVTLARVYVKSALHAQAIAHAESALSLAHGGDAKYVEAAAFHALGSAHAGLGNNELAAEHFQRAVDTYRKMDMRFEESEVFVDLGDLYDGQGDAARARDYWQRALATLVEMRHPLADAVLDRLTNLGQEAAST